MMPTFRAVWVLACLAVACGCTSTRLSNVWSSPEVKGPVSFSNIVVACFFADEPSRRSAEDQLVTRIGEDRATPSYRLISLVDAKDTDKVQEVIEQEGFDGALVLRLVSVDKERAWVPGGASARPGYYELILRLLLTQLEQRVLRGAIRDRHDREHRDAHLQARQR